MLPSHRKLRKTLPLLSRLVRATVAVMPTPSRPADYDPYGQAILAVHPAEHLLRLPVLLFWAAALMLLAGRLAVPVQPLDAPAASAITPDIAAPA